MKYIIMCLQQRLSESNRSVRIYRDSENLIRWVGAYGLQTIYHLSEIVKTERPTFIDPSAGINIVAIFEGRF